MFVFRVSLSLSLYPWGAFVTSEFSFKIEKCQSKAFDAATKTMLKFYFVCSHTNDVYGGLQTAVWPDLAKFRHFGQMLITSGKLLNGLFSVWHYFERAGKIVWFWANINCCKCLNIENNRAIWPHCKKVTYLIFLALREGKNCPPSLFYLCSWW